MKNNTLFKNIKLISVFNQIPVEMIIIDNRGCVLAVNDFFSETFHVDNRDLNNIKFEKSPNQPIENNKKTNLFSENDLNFNKTLEIKNKNGKSYQFEFILLDSEKNNQILYLGIIKKDKAELELKLELERQLLMKENIEGELVHESELSEMKSRFLSIASHEFRTPLAGIISSLNLINRYILADEKAWLRFKNREKIINHLNKINESVKNLTTIISKFLTLGNIEKGEIPLRYTTFDLKQALELQKTQFQEISKPGQRITHVHKGTETMIRLDKYLLRNIMNNLVSNAIKFSRENSEIQIISSIEDDNFNLIIRDNGIGIPEAEQNKIFRRFYRAKNALNFQEGTGLGLNIVKKYVELMKGSITFESKENIGTTFFINIPNIKG